MITAHLLVLHPAHPRKASNEAPIKQGSPPEGGSEVARMRPQEEATHFQGLSKPSVDCLPRWDAIRARLRLGISGAQRYRYSGDTKARSRAASIAAEVVVRGSLGTRDAPL